ncbi:MAG: alanine--glyoxylate aminotransferase family protein [Eubacteriales bacterium]|nr:alanine--glyoxylate aminotransferase family protein [Eubacteriales bacterium]
MKTEKLLLIPGPTMIPEKILNAMNTQAVGHRTEYFENIIKEVTIKLKKVFRTERDVYILTSSGSGAMEASVANFINEGDKTLVLVNGKFGERFASLNKVYGADLNEIIYPLGVPANPDDVESFLEKNPETKAVFMQQNETSSTILNDVKAIAAVVKKYDALLIVDSVSGLGVTEMKMDEWGIDVIAAGSQKAFMLPPGLAFVAVSEKAEKKLSSCGNKRYYFCLKAAKKNLEKSTTPYTPATSLIRGLDKSLDMILEYGIEKNYEKQEKYTKMLREAFKTIGLSMVVENDQAASRAVTGVYVPEGVKWSEFERLLSEKYNVLVAGGQDELKGKIFRVGTIGYLGDLDILSGIAAIEMALFESGYIFELGNGVSAAQKILIERGKN